MAFPEFIWPQQGSRVLCWVLLQGLAKMAAEGSVRAFWRGNGANVAKNIPEMVRSFDGR